MAIDNTLGLITFLKYFFEKLDKILKDEKINWKDIPAFIGILFKVKLAIAGIANLNEELTHSSDSEVGILVSKLQEISKQLSDIIIAHQSDVFQTGSEPEVDMTDFNEDEFRRQMLDNGMIISYDVTLS